jgi:hypothetical protein
MSVHAYIYVCNKIQISIGLAQSLPGKKIHLQLVQEANQAMLR